MHKFGYYSPPSSSAPEQQRHQQHQHQQQQQEVTMPVAECDPEQEDDFVAGLVEQMAHSMLEEDDGEEEEEEEDLSPPCLVEQHRQSCRIWAPVHDFNATANTGGASASLSERRSGWSSSNTSPSPAVSPPTPLQHVQYESKNDAWELLHMAAQEVMRLKMGRAVPPVSSAHHYNTNSSSSSREELRQSSSSSPSSFRHGSQVEIPTAPYNNDLSAGSARLNKSACPAAFGQQEWKQRSTTRHHSCYQVSQGSSQGVPTAYATTNRRVGASRAYQQSQQQQQVRQQIANNNRSMASLHPTVAGSPPCYRTTAASSLPSGAQHWSPPQPPNTSASGMRAVFLRGPSSTSSGTGVFLPQATGTGTNRDQNRKPACSTVLLPSRIVEVLHLNVDELNCQAQHQTGEASNGGLMQQGGPGDDEFLNAQLSKSYSACSPTRWHSAAEHALPTEWTY